MMVDNRANGILPIVYLSGGFYGDYKSEIKLTLENAGFLVYDPETAELPHHIPGEYVGRDFAAIRGSTVVLAYMDDYPFVYGTAAEIGYAVAVNVPVILVCVRARIDSFLAACARAVFTEIPPAVAFIVERYG